MIGYLKGEILDHSDGKMLIGVGDVGRVGYSVSVPQSAAYGTYSDGQTLELYIYTHVREEAFDLYGFHSKYEKALFLILLSVSGVGPKSALGILSGIEPEQLVNAIIQGDQALLTRTPGVGKKTAERIIVELRDSLKKKLDSGLIGRPSVGLATGATVRDIAPSVGSSVFEDAKSALIGLGYREQEVLQILHRVMQDFQPTRSEDLIRTALKQIAVS